MHALLAICALFSWLGQEAEPSPIEPDRPDFTDGPAITPKGKIVLETGYRQTRAEGVRHEYGDEPTARIGLTSNLEARIILPAYSVEGGVQGFEDAGLGFKWRIREGADGKGLASPSFAVESGLSVPSGSRHFRSKRVQPSVIGIVSWDFGDVGDLAANVGASWQDNGQSLTAVWSASLSFDHSFSKRVGAFLESYALFPSGDASQVFADAGVTYLLNNDAMLDVFAGTRLNRSALERFFGAGVSFRF